LLDEEYFEEKEYTDSQKSEIELLWSKLGDDMFTLKNDLKMINAMNKRDEQVCLLAKIQGLEVNRDLLISLYQNYENVNDFSDLEQKILYNFTLIDDIITPKYFDGLEVNVELVNSFITSYSTKYKIEFTKQEEEVKVEITNVYNIIALVEQCLNRPIGDINKITVSQFLAYEKIAEQISESNKTTTNGR
jgi:hypothetical protein